MGTPAFDRIMEELTAHPKERIGFRQTDFEVLVGEEKKLVNEHLFAQVEEGLGSIEPLKWLHASGYVSQLKLRLASLPPKSHGLVFLPYLLYLETGDRTYLLAMMREIVAADPAWEGREHALGGYLRKIIGGEPLYWDFCRFVILNVPGISLKKYAMLWLAYEKGYPLQHRSLPQELEAAVTALDTSRGADPVAKAVLDGVHRDTGSFQI